MKKLLIFLLIPVASFGQKLPDFGVGKVRLIETDKTILAEVYPVPKNVKVKNNRSYYWYGSNMIHSTQGGYSGKLLNGSYSEYYLNKNLKEQGIFKKGLKDGAWKSWNINGVLIQELGWREGELSGIFKLYNDDGKLRQQGRYHDDLLQGEVIGYAGKDSGKVLFYDRGRISTKPKHFWSKLNFFKKKN